MILVAYRHGLRVSELTDLHWDQIDFNAATLHVRRAKRGTPATHPIVGDEMRALRREYSSNSPYGWVGVSLQTAPGPHGKQALPIMACDQISPRGVRRD